MILNMNGGYGPVTVVDFTLSENTPVDSTDASGNNVLVISNVFLRGETIHGFVIQSLTESAANYPHVVMHFYTTYYNDDEHETRLRFASFENSASGYEFTLSYNPNANAFVYNPANKTLTVSTALSGTFMKAGIYRLMIW